jgi:protein O-mannosyl-transferase
MKEKLQQWLVRHPEAIWAIVIFLLAFVQYANTIGHDYAWDDDIVIRHNARVKQGFSGIPSHFVFRTRENFEDFTGYRPITMSSFSIDYGLFGARPWVGHLMNVLYFSLLCVVMFRTLRRIFPNFHAAFAFFITLLFVVHPLHVEAVANIKSRDEILSLLFALLSLSFFVQHYRSKKWWQLGVSLAFLILGAWSKENALTFLGVLPITVVFLLEGTWREKAIGIGKYAVVLVGIIGVFLLATGKMPGSPSPVAAKGYMESQTLGNCLAVWLPSNWERIANSTHLYWLNVEKFFYPRNLVYFSGYNMIRIWDWTTDRIPLAILFDLIVLPFLLTIFLRRKWKVLLYAIWFFDLTVVIYLQLPGFLLADTIANRFMFMPSLALCIFAVQVLYGLLRLDRTQNPMVAFLKVGKAKLKLARTRNLVLVSILAVVTLLGLSMTWSRNKVWKNNLTLFSHDLPLLENCARAHYYYASELVTGYASSQNPSKTKNEIIRHYQRAIDITPQSYYAYTRLAEFHLNLREYPPVIALCDSALKYYANQADVWHYKGKALYYLERYEDAALSFERSRKLGPEHDDTWEFLARAYERSGQFDAAFQTLDVSMKRNPNYLFYYDVLSDTHFDAGDTLQSFQPILKLLELDGENPVWWRKLIGRYQIVGDNEKASYYYQQALNKGLQL